MEDVRERFVEIFGKRPRVFRAPGRVNLIGEHTDYNDGFVMPFAIDRESQAAAVVRDDTRFIIHALDLGESHEFDLGEEPVKRRGNWRDYAEGTARSLLDDFDLKCGVDLAFTSNVPVGAGLSSSAAIEVSIGSAILGVNGIHADPRKLAFAAQKAEHEFVGIRSGIMDQFTSALACRGNALFLDCRSLETVDIPVDIDGAMIAVCDTKVKHELASTEYNTRREECEEAVKLIAKKNPSVRSLRDVDVAEFEGLSETLPPTIRKRAKHVITENARTVEAADALRERRALQMGELMFASHESLRHDYEVSCDELDVLVDTAMQIDGIFGSRMTGGGFGGCTVTLLKVEAWEGFQQRTAEKFSGVFGYAPDIYVFEASAGASELT